jgi:hypothetical protein
MRVERQIHPSGLEAKQPLGIEFIEHGSHDRKGLPGSWNLFAVAR